MTERALVKRIAYFAARLTITKDHQDTPQGKRAYTMARNLWRQSRKQLMRLQATGSIRGWHEIKLDD